MGGHSLAAPHTRVVAGIGIALWCWGHPYQSFQRLGPLQALQEALERFIHGAQVPCGTTWTWQWLGLDSEDVEQPHGKALEQ